MYFFNLNICVRVYLHIISLCISICDFKTSFEFVRLLSRRSSSLTHHRDHHHHHHRDHHHHNHHLVLTNWALRSPKVCRVHKVWVLHHRHPDLCIIMIIMIKMIIMIIIKIVTMIIIKIIIMIIKIPESKIQNRITVGTD